MTPNGKVDRMLLASSQYIAEQVGLVVRSGAVSHRSVVTCMMDCLRLVQVAALAAADKVQEMEKPATETEASLMLLFQGEYVYAQGPWPWSAVYPSCSYSYFVHAPSLLFHIFVAYLLEVLARPSMPSPELLRPRRAFAHDCSAAVRN